MRFWCRAARKGCLSRKPSSVTSVMRVMLLIPLLKLWPPRLRLMVLIMRAVSRARKRSVRLRYGSLMRRSVHWSRVCSSLWRRMRAPTMSKLRILSVWLHSPLARISTRLRWARSVSRRTKTIRRGGSNPSFLTSFPSFYSAPFFLRDRRVCGGLFFLCGAIVVN